MMDKVCEYVKDQEFRFSVFHDRVHVMNYKKILNLENNEISFLSSEKKIILRGNNLSLKKLLDDEFLIVGDIEKIEVLSE